MHDPVGDLDRVLALVQAPGRLEIHQLAGDVAVRDVEVVLALAGGELRVQLGGLRVHEVCREVAGVAAEQRVGQRDVAPEAAGQVQSHEEDGQRVEGAAGGVGTHPLAEDGAVGQRELQVPGEQAGVERLAVLVDPTGDDGQRLDGRHVEATQVAQGLELPAGQRLGDLLDRQDRPAELDEADDVARDAAGERREVALRPVLQRDLPGQVEHRRVRLDRGEVQRHTRKPRPGSPSSAPGVADGRCGPHRAS